MRTQMRTQLWHKRWSIFAVTILLIALGNSNAFAAPPTEAGTTVSNSATVNYQVGGISQPAITSTACTFMVDRKVDHTIAILTASTNVTPGSQNNLLQFKLTNTGNKKQAYTITRAQLAGAAAAANIEVWYDANGNSTYEEGSDTKLTDKTNAVQTFFNLEFNTQSNTIWVTGDFLNTVTNGQEANMEIYAVACDVGTTTAETNDNLINDVYNTEQTVFADIDNNGDNGADGDTAKDGIFSARAKFVVASAVLTVAKTSYVLDDPFNGTTKPKRIPGATILYDIQVSNGAGASQATAVTISDVIPTTELSYVTQYNATAGQGIFYVDPTHAANTEYTNAGSDDNGDFGITTANAVTVSGITLNASEHIHVKFKTTIK